MLVVYVHHISTYYSIIRQLCDMLLTLLPIHFIVCCDIL